MKAIFIYITTGPYLPVYNTLVRSSARIFRHSISTKEYLAQRFPSFVFYSHIAYPQKLLSLTDQDNIYVTDYYKVLNKRVPKQRIYYFLDAEKEDEIGHTLNCGKQTRWTIDQTKSNPDRWCSISDFVIYTLADIHNFTIQWSNFAEYLITKKPMPLYGYFTNYEWELEFMSKQFLFSYDMSSFKIAYSHVSNNKETHLDLLAPFPHKVWLLCFIGLIVLILMNWLGRINRNMKKKTKSELAKTLLQSGLEYLKIVTDQGILYKPFPYLIVTSVFCIFICSSFYRNEIAACLIVPSHPDRIQSVEELLDNNYTLCFPGFESSRVNSSYQVQWLAKQIILNKKLIGSNSSVTEEKLTKSLLIIPKIKDFFRLLSTTDRNLAVRTPMERNVACMASSSKRYCRYIKTNERTLQSIMFGIPSPQEVISVTKWLLQSGLIQFWSGLENNRVLLIILSGYNATNVNGEIKVSGNQYLRIREFKTIFGVSIGTLMLCCLICIVECWTVKQRLLETYFKCRLYVIKICKILFYC